MSVILDFSICQQSGCDALVFKELTGEYNSSTNPTGWTTAELLNPTVANLTITLANGSSYTIDLLATGDFPTTDTSLEYEITPTQIGYSSDTDQIVDQIATFTYTVTTDTGTYTQTISKAFYCQVQCCVNTMFLELDFECDCNKDAIDLALKAFAMLQGLKQAANCGNSSNFNNILTQLNKLCANSSCSACN